MLVQFLKRSQFLNKHNSTLEVVSWVWWASSSRQHSTTGLHIPWYFSGDYRKGKKEKTHRLRLGSFYKWKMKGVKASGAEEITSRRLMFNQSSCNNNFGNYFPHLFFVVEHGPVWCSGHLCPFKAQPAHWKGQSEKDLGAVEALLSNGWNIPALSMLFWPPIKTTEPYRLLWRKLAHSKPKPVKWVAPKFQNWSDLLVDWIFNCIFRMFSLTKLLARCKIF